MTSEDLTWRIHIINLDNAFRDLVDIIFTSAEQLMLERNQFWLIRLLICAHMNDEKSIIC